MKNGQFRPKSVTKLKTTNINNFNYNSNNINSNIEKKGEKKLITDINNSNNKKVKCKLTFNEWLKVKNKQKEYFNIILQKKKK